MTTAGTRTAFEAPLGDALAQRPDDAYRLLARGQFTDESLPPRAFTDVWGRAKFIAEREGFLHWEAAFPGVWHGWQDARPQGGFDADHRQPAVGSGSSCRRWSGSPLVHRRWLWLPLPLLRRHRHTAAARQRGDRSRLSSMRRKKRPRVLGRLVRASGHYPLLGGGDINLYSLFVERAMGLIKPDGFVGLLTPSGIYGGKT